MVQNYLASMGIQVWKSRRVLPGAKTAVHYQNFHLLKNEQVCGCLQLEWNADVAGNAAKVNPLLDAMLSAIQLQRSALKTSASSKSYPTLIMRLLPFEPALEPSVVTTYHPFDLLQQPLFKRQAWKDLQRFALHLEKLP